MWLENGEFGEGTMAPKICAAIYFLQYHGQKVVITSLEKIEDAINGKAGTIITNKGKLIPGYLPPEDLIKELESQS